MSISTAPTSRTSGDVSSVLVEVCRQSGHCSPVPSGAGAELVAAARFHRVAPLVHKAYRDAAPDVAELLRPDQLRAVAVHLQACATLRQLSTVLGGLGWVTFKGPVFSEHAHPVPGLRSYNDVDVLVAPSNLRGVTELLWAADWRLADYRDMLRNPAVPGEMHWISPQGALVDLHWSMINMASRRRLFDIETSELLRRRVSVPLGSDAVWTLDPTDALVHACLHAAGAGANKLIYLLDVDCLSRGVIDWDAVSARSQEWRAQAQVALVLGRARRVLGAPVPADFGHHAQVSRLVRGLCALTDRITPVARGRVDEGLSRFVARAVQPTGRATTRAVGRNAGRWLIGRTKKPRAAGDDRLGADWDSLEIYLQAVEWAGDPSS